MASFYWVGGTDDWNGTAGSKWASQSGIASNLSTVPTSTDDVYLDAGSGSVTVTVASGHGNCANLFLSNFPGNLTISNTFAINGDFSFSGSSGTVTISASITLTGNLNCAGFTGTLAGTSSFNIAGGITLGSGMTRSYTGSITFSAASGTHLFTSNGISLDSTFIFSGSAATNSGGTWKFADNLTNGPTRALTLTRGTIDGNNKNYAGGSFLTTGTTTRSLIMGSGTWTFQSTSGTLWNISNASGFTLNSGTSTIKLAPGTGSTRTFAGNDQTYYNLWYAPTVASALAISGSNTFNNIRYDALSGTAEVAFQVDETTTVNTFSVSGTSGNPVTIQTTGDLGTHYLVKTGKGIISCDYLSIENSSASPADTWYAGANSTNVSGNSGWVFSVPPVKELAFHPCEQHFTISGVFLAATKFYVQYSTFPDFSSSYGSPSYGISTTAAQYFTHLVKIDPAAAGPGDVVYWRLVIWNGSAFNEYGDTHKTILRKRRSDNTGWSFVVGPNARSSGGDISDDSKENYIPTALSFAPDFMVFPGNLATITASANWNSIRTSLDHCGIDLPVYISPGQYDNDSSARGSRLTAFPCASLFTDGQQVIRSPYNDVQSYERSSGSNETGSYYFFAWGNAMFVVLNDWHNQSSSGSANVPSSYEREWFESVLKEHRHKYKWCFTFSSTAVDAIPPGASGTIAQHESLQDWLMSLQNLYKVTAHFSGGYHGWRCRKHNNGTLYVNANFGATLAGSSTSEWHAHAAFAHVRIGIDENGLNDEEFCRVDIVHSGADDSSGYTQGQVINTSTSESGVCEAFAGSILDKNDTAVDIFSANSGTLLIPRNDTNWIYSDQSNPSSTTVDHIISEQFYKTDYQPVILDSSMSASDQQQSWKVGQSPFIGGTVSSDWTDGYSAHNVSSGGASSISAYQLSGNTALSIDAPSPCYFIKHFDVEGELAVTELQIIYELKDAAYIWINGILAWYSDGEGTATSTGPPFSSAQRPRLRSEWVDSTSSLFVSTITGFEPEPDPDDRVVSSTTSRRRLPSVHYGTSGQPIRITNQSVISSIKTRGNVIAVMLVQGRTSGSTPMVASNAAMDLELVAFGSAQKYLFAPYIVSPTEGQMFNYGVVNVRWTKQNPPAANLDVDNDTITYEIEYTDNYIGRDTNWITIKRRIPWSDESMSWKVGKSIKSDSVRIRMRTKSSFNEQYSDWVMSNTFSVNVFNLIAPAIISPMPNSLYSDFLLIILDETLTKNTYHQKVRYTLEYASQKQDIDWTVIIQNVPVGQNVIRWNLDDVPTSDDYSIRITAKNVSTCFEEEAPEPDQIAKSFVHNVRIQQSGLFLIDTKAPQSVIEIEQNTGITNRVEQILNVFAEDDTTQVEQIQMRECDASAILSLGDISEIEPEECEPISDLITQNVDFDRIIGKPINNNAKIQWLLDSDKSGYRKIEAILTDSGGNSSIQDVSKVFISVFSSGNNINDFIVTIEQRDKVTIQTQNGVPAITVTPSVFEVAYLVTEYGELWVVEPFPRMIYTIEGDIAIKKIFNFNGVLLLFAYDSTNDVGYVYRHDNTKATLIHTFDDEDSITTGVATFVSVLYVGLKNGQLWKYNGFSFSQMSISTSDPISTLYSDESYLYIGYETNSYILLYNGDTFFQTTI